MIRINDSKSKTTLKGAFLVCVLLLLAVATGFGQNTVNLTAGPTTTTLPDGTIVPMWGYSCGAVSGATCAALNPNAPASTWSPVVITVPAGTPPAGASLTINLTNNLSFTTTGATNNIPTSIVIVGQIGGGLGSSRTTTPSPDHSNAQGCVSWFIAANPPGTPCTAGNNAGLASPPNQGPRVQSMATEVAAGSTTSLNWGSLRPGTYLLESGTHPSIQVPMGLIGMLVVTNAPTGTATGVTANSGTAYGAGAPTHAAAIPVVSYSAEVPLEFSEIDPVQNKAVDTAVRTAGFAETTVWSGMNTGNVVDSVAVAVAGTNYTTPPKVSFSGGGGTGAAATATIDTTTGSPTFGQVTGITMTNGGGGYTSAPVVTLTGGTSGTNAMATASVVATAGCALTHTCYPPAVNYTPFYYLINGVAFSKNTAGYSLFPATAGAGVTTGIPASTSTAASNLLVRLVNAGLKMHVPSIVGAQTTGFNGGGSDTGGVPSTTLNGFTLVAEDGNPVPDYDLKGNIAPRVKTEVFMAAGKTYDVMVNVPASGGSALPIFDRELSLSANSSIRDAGMLAYIGVNGNGIAGAAGSASASTFGPAAMANPDTYNSLVAGQPFSVSDPSKGVIANDINVYGVALTTLPTNGSLSCNLLAGNPVPGICANGTFTYTPNAGSTATTDSFGYCANGAAANTTGLCTTVTLGAAALSTGPSAIPQSYTAMTASYIKIPSPGLLLGNSDQLNLPISVVTTASTAPSGYTLIVDPKGGFTLQGPGASTSTVAVTVSFGYTVQNSQGNTASGTVQVKFPPPSNLQVNVLDAQAYNNCGGDSACIAALTPFKDYRWIIEEDKTFYVDPNCTTNSSITTPGCAAPVAAGGTIPTFGVQFHTSSMGYVAQGCTGPLSCEAGQTMLDTAPACTAPGVPAGCSATGGQHVPAVCDLGNGACRPDPTGKGYLAVTPDKVALDPGKRYYISVLPGDAANPFPGNTGAPNCSGEAGSIAADPNQTQCGHAMSGAPIPAACNVLGAGASGPACPAAYTNAVNVLVAPTPLPTGKLTVVVFEDDFPLNGEQDGGGGTDTIAPLEPGLGGFNLVLWDTFGSLGDVTGQDTYDMFNQPLSNSLDGTVDPATGLNACPITNGGAAISASNNGEGITGMIVTCPKFESDGTTLSPLAGQAVVANLMPDKFSVQAYPGADRIARGEEWIQTNTLDGQHPHDAFIRIGEPSYFQEYGPAGYHVQIGFANPAIINSRLQEVCNGLGSPGTVGACTNTVDGQVDVERLSRTPDQRLYPSGSRDAFSWSQCWVSLGDPDGEDFMFTKCDANGNFKFTGVPGGQWRLTIGDQWNDQIIDGLSTPVNVGCSTPNTSLATCTGGNTVHMNNIGVQQWQANLYTKTCVDDNHNGICDDGEIGIPLIYTWIHYRDGSRANALTTDFNGVANFNETFPLFNWYVAEADSTRYKTTGIHTVYDAGGPADGSVSCGQKNAAGRNCGTSTAYNYFTNTNEALPLPADLSVPGAVYCKTADCVAEAASFQAGTAIASNGTNATTNGPTLSTGRIDPPWVWSEGASLLTGQSNWIEFAKAPYADGENGGIYGKVAYASTRPFDDASQMIEQPWAPNVPNVTVNLYQEGFASDGVTPTLTMVDTTMTSSWDAWAQGFYPSSTKPYLSCPGQGQSTGTEADLFFFTLFDQPNYLDYYNSIHGGGAVHNLPYNSQYKCYDSMHIGNQLQPAPYDGRYSFPSVLGIDPTSGKALAVKGSTNGVASSMNGTNCTICVGNPTTSTMPAPGADMGNYDPYRAGTPMLPPGKYVVEVIMPPGYEVYKEEDKNLLIGDNFIAPAAQQFGGLGGDVFILPDQASVASMYDESAAGYNPSNYQNETTATGLSQELSGVPGFPGYTDPVWPCVGEMRVVPDYLSLFPQNKETAPFAGATRPLCDRKEVNLTNQMAVNARFFIYTSTHIASKFTGVITDDLTAEFDPFAPQFGEKFGPPNQPVSTKDYLGNELSRVYSDHWGAYDGLTYSSWDVNPPNITGYSPAMMVQCMNDPGPILDTNPLSPTHGQMIQDPLYNPAYSNFCYTNPYMPGLTTYNDTPVVPTEAFVGAGYNNVDCSYPDSTPAISEVDSSDGIGPWVSAFGHTITITSLGTVQVNNSGYAGPSANAAPFNQKTIARNYNFGSQGTVTVGGVPLSITSWSPTSITGTVNQSCSTIATILVPACATATTVPQCAVQQQAQYGGPGTAANAAAYCGEVVITNGAGQQSIDAVTLTIGGKAPTHIPASQTIQSYIDAAAPGDLLIVDPTCTTATSAATTSSAGTGSACSGTVTGATTTGTSTTTTVGTITSKVLASHNEMLLMWKPVRLQGVGAATSIVDSSAFPAGKLLDPWRRHVNCLFGLTLQGVPIGTGTNNTYDPTSQYSCPDAGWAYFGTATTPPGTGGSSVPNMPQVDRLPLEAILGWDATQNGNLAEQLQEPSLMGAFEGAGITVMGKGLEYHGQAPWSDGTETGAYPTQTTLLSGVGPTPSALPVGDANPYCHTGSYDANTGVFTQSADLNPYPSDFTCNPSTIDGLTIRDSSQGGGGIFVHGWAHYLQIANDRVYNNVGTLTGGISVGQGEFATPYVANGTTNAAPGSCSDGTGWIANQHLPYCLQDFVSVHNNMVTSNSSLGDELFSGTLAGGGGVTFCTGNDYYLFNYNWVCGNLSSGEGGGVVQLGEIQNGDIEHNTIALNQSSNPTIPTNGGGIQIMGTPDTDPVCGTILDQDCPPGLSDGIGHNLKINANLIQANQAESGAGGGIRLQQVNGTDVATFGGIYAITAADEGHAVTVRVPATVPAVPLPALGDTVVIAGVSVAGYNGTFTVIATGAVGGGGRGFTYIDPALALNTPQGNGGTFTDTTHATVPAAEPITRANEAGGGVVTIASGLSPSLNDTVVIANVAPGGYNGTYVVTGIPVVGTFTYTKTGGGQLGEGTGFGTVTDNNQSSAALWNSVAVTNNIIVNNVAGWDGAGISLQDSLNVSIINNTISNNDTLASSGVLTQSIGTPDASAPAGSCVGPTGGTSCPQPSGVSSVPNSSLMTSAIGGIPVAASQGTTASIICPFAEGNGTASTTNPGVGATVCAGFSDPLLANNLIYHNRAFHVGVSGAQAGPQGYLSQQNVITLFAGLPNTSGTITDTAAGSQTSTGQCFPSIDSYWDLGVRGDSSPTLRGPFLLHPVYSLLTSTTGYTGANNVAAPTGGPQFVSSYCNGSRVPPECTVADGCGGPAGYGVPPGIADAVGPNPVFSLTPSATVDEGNNWINVSYGPMSLSNESIAPTGGNYGAVPPLGNYALDSNSPAIDAISTGEALPAGSTYPRTDFFGNPRPEAPIATVFDYGAVEYQHAKSAVTPTLTSISPSSGLIGTTVNVTLTGTNLLGASAVNVSGTGITVSGVGVVSSTTVVATFTIASNATVGARTVSVTTPVGTTNNVAFSVTAPTPTITSISPTSGTRGTTVTPVVITGNNLTGGVVTVSGTGVTVSGTTSTATQITTTFTISATAATGPRTVTVTVAGACGAAPLTACPTIPFTVVNPAAPTLTSISPNNGSRGTTVAVTLTGSNFTTTGTTIAVAGGGITTNTLVVNAAGNSITANFVISGTAGTGPHNVTVTTPGGTTTPAVPFYVGPALTAVSPTGATVVRGGSATQITLSGYLLTGAAGTGTPTVGVSGTGVTCTVAAGFTATSVTANCTATAGAALTARSVSVTVGGVTSNALAGALTVVNPAVATLTSITPASSTAAQRGTTVAVTLTGTHFTTGTTVAVSGPGVTSSGVTVVNTTTITANFAISGSATTGIGAHNVTVTNASGTASNAVTFTKN